MIRVEIEAKKTIQRIINQSLFFKKTNKIYAPVVKIIKRKKENIQINKIRNKKDEIITNTTKT